MYKYKNQKITGYFSIINLHKLVHVETYKNIYFDFVPASCVILNSWFILHKLCDVCLQKVWNFRL